MTQRAVWPQERLFEWAADRGGGWKIAPPWLWISGGANGSTGRNPHQPAVHPIECDAIWSFCYAKQKNVPDEHRGTFEYGDVWTWTAICADTKIVPSWLMGERTGEDAEVFMRDLASRLTKCS